MLLLIDNYSSFWLHMMQNDSPADSNSISFDESKSLAQALQEKVQLHSTPVILFAFRRRESICLTLFNFYS